MVQMDPSLLSEDKLYSLAYGSDTLGMPIQGLESSIENLNSEVINGFLEEHFTAERMIVVANGVRNHEEFVNMVGERFSKHPIRRQS